MPEVDFALLCDHVRIDGGVANLLGGGIDTVFADSVPAAQTVGLLVRFTFETSECGREHRFEVIFLDMDGQRLAELGGNMRPEMQAGLPVGWKTGALLGLNFGILLPSYGQYAFEILINDSHKKTLNLRVVEPQRGA
jgi:hypothetical protein